MNTPVTPAGQCPFHAQLKEKGENFDMFGAAYQTDPAEALKEFREQLPIFYSEAMGHWIVTRYEDVKAVFRDPIVFSAYNEGYFLLKEINFSLQSPPQKLDY